MANEYDPILRVIDEYDLPTDEVDEQLVTRARETYAEWLKEIEQLKARAAKSEAAYLRLQNELKDDPQWDATDAAHPAWWRGQEAASKVWAARVEKLEAEFALPPPGALIVLDEYQSRAMGIKLAELERLRTLLASGQCVDLAKVSDDALIGSIMGDLINFVPQSVIDESAAESRQWLISKAGVKL